MEHIAKTLVVRELQANRQVDIVSLRSRLAVKLPSEKWLKGAIISLKKSGALDGETCGIDPMNGYEYKRWRIVNPEKAKKAIKNMGIRTMPPSGIDRIKKQIEAPEQT